MWCKRRGTWLERSATFGIKKAPIACPLGRLCAHAVASRISRSRVIHRLLRANSVRNRCGFFIKPR